MIIHTNCSVQDILLTKTSQEAQELPTTTNLYAQHVHNFTSEWQVIHFCEQKTENGEIVIYLDLELKGEVWRIKLIFADITFRSLSLYTTVHNYMIWAY